VNEVVHEPAREGASALAKYLAENRRPAVKLHLGCGGKRWEDFVNVDLYPFDPNVKDTSRSGCIADVFADIRHLDIPADTIDDIFTSHTLEHFPRWQTVEMVRDWHRMMKPGGRLVVEMPDFVRCVLWLFHPRRHKRYLARTQFYGNQWDRLEYETHRYVWSAREFTSALREIGFRKVSVTHRTLTHNPGRDMRVTALK
jgi:predicted SAM-dependent methyltransferase